VGSSEVRAETNDEGLKSVLFSGLRMYIDDLSPDLFEL
jgi:hypothetical protein